MRKLFTMGVLLLTFFSFTALSISASFAAEVEGVEGGSYLTFLRIGHSINLDILSFEEGGIFSMSLLEEKMGGAGTYTDLGLLFTAEWTSDDKNTTYTLEGISLVSLVIIGRGEKTVTEGSETDTDDISFLGILGILIPD